MMILLYLIVLAGCAFGGMQFVLVLGAAESAPQQAAGAAMALGWAILPYVAVRAIDRMVASHRQAQTVELLRGLRSDLKPAPLPVRNDPPIA